MKEYVEPVKEIDYRKHLWAKVRTRNGTRGTVTNVEYGGRYPIRIDWSNGSHDIYTASGQLRVGSESDLDLAGLVEVTTITNNNEVGANMAYTQADSFGSKLTSIGGKVLAFLKALVSGDFEVMGRAINTVKGFILNNPISRLLRFVVRKGRAMIRNPKRWLLALFGVGAFGEELLELGAALFDTGMKVAEAWLPATVYKMLDGALQTIIGMAMRLVKLVTDNRPVRYIRAGLSRVFGKAFELWKAIKTYVKGKIAEKFAATMGV